MDIGTLAGFVIGTFCVVGVGMQWQVGPFIDIPSIGIVFGGCGAGLLISLAMSTLKTMPKSGPIILRQSKDDPVEIIKKMVEFSEVARRDGILALENVLEQIPDPFMRQGLQLAVDGTDPELIQDIMETDLDNIEARHADAKSAWDMFRGGGPTWGALGTVIGLIQMLKGGVDDPSALTQGMAVALITTFYGSLIASLMVGPICDKLGVRNGEEMATKTIILKGVMSIQAGDNPRIVEQKLKIFLAPADRNFGKDV
ncbi:MAG: MotA/TolQ/ExbB proton channel family protein [Planctomycetota bacterium]|jgi:chemotaxis protein MotA|nr:MotA/TolQ/ExbB proton channel family protein [Planctomycetota bacterium]